MKSYLSLIPISAKVHRRRNRMTILCIVFAVFLVTAIFSVADMVTQGEHIAMINKHGNWHISLSNVSRDTAQGIRVRPDVTAAGFSSVFNLDGEQPYYVNEKKAVLYGTEEACIKQISNGITEGDFPQKDDQVMLSPNAAGALKVWPGDEITVHTPAGDRVFTVSGLGTDDKGYYEGQTYLVGVYMTQGAFSSLMEQNKIADNDTTLYVQFQNAAKAAKAKKELAAQYGLPEESISENTGVMGTAGYSKSKSMNGFYQIAAILFVLVLLAGTLMISGSMNSNLAQRTQFFGMMRCIGASRRQIIRFVRLEALNWCKRAAPMGMLLGTLASWSVCGMLRYGIGGEWDTMPVFKVSSVGLICGAMVGIITVLLSAESPARRAARVSPVSAVSGNAGNTPAVRRAASTGFLKIESSLGIHHAVAVRKGWFFMTASFALGIILLLSFSVLLDFAKLLMPSQSVTTADLALNGYANARILDRELVDEIRKMEGVSNVYGCNYRDNIPAVSLREGIDHVNVVSYDETLLEYAKESVVQGDLSEIYGNSNKAATVFNKDNPLKVGDIVKIGSTEIEISCILSQGLFGDSQILICSQKTYDRLMGPEKYCLIGVQLGRNATEETAARIRDFENSQVIVSDLRESNQQNNTTYLATRMITYGFLAIIGIITLFNIVNSISMSVSARTKQYGAMRAVGMDGGQLTRMIAAEAFTYAVSGLIAGFGIGIPLSRFLYIGLITRHLGVEWRLSGALIGIVIVFVVFSALIAVYAPAKRICNMAITATINEL